jgi:DNA invertase Pin-like site-specific DNA recombinase
MSAREQRLRQKREELLAAAKRRTLISLWSGAWIAVSLSEALDLTTASGRALAGMLAVFAEFERDILRDRVKAGIAQARKEGKPHGRPITAGLHLQKVKELFRKGLSKREIAKQIGISRTSVRRLLAPPDHKGQLKH